MKIKLLFVSLLCLPTLVFASSTNLLKSIAVERAQKISEVFYDWNIHLTKNETYSGTLEVSFKLSDKSKSIPLDFFKGTIHKLTINGADVKPKYDGQSIELEKDLLVIGQNLVQVKYNKTYNHDGSGLTRVKDPKDGRVYLYTQFETMDANQVFPCFDQPDLKAYYTMSVTAPQAWEIITSVREKKVRYNRKKERVWTFPKSEKFSTYLISLHAGPFKIWKSQAGKIPLRLFARRSIAKNVKYQEWFKITKLGFEFFQKEFGYPYPYKKYDQLIMPEYNHGAMENVAAVTFNENFISRGKKSRASKRDHANTILHEMAHMWFGNLVTMVWWNDLWLNESFATYSANQSLYKATEYKEVWRSFYSKTKGWGYWEDGLVTTHPIETEVPDVRQASTNFDGISYGKGAAVLKQLNFYIGEKVFRKGVQNYFKKFAGQNTTRADFVGELSIVYGKSLDKWQQKWLQTAGVNKISVEPICKAGLLKSLIVSQIKDGASKILRPHKFQIALLDRKNTKMVLSKKLVVDIQEARKTIKIPGAVKCPEMIYPNFEDHGYFQAKLDEVTVSNLFTQITSVEDEFLREMFWRSLWQMVREGDLDIYTYGDLLLKNAFNEEDDDILDNNLSNIFENYAGDASLAYYLPIETEKQRKRKTEILDQFEEAIWQRLKTSKAGSDRQRTWYDHYVSSVRAGVGVERLKHILSGKIKFKNFKVDQDRRWKLVVRLAQLGAADIAKIVALEVKRDSSHRAKIAQLQIKAAQPSWSRKLEMIKQVERDNSELSLSEVRGVMGALFPPNQNNFREKHGLIHYDRLKELVAKKDAKFLRVYNWILPLECRGTKQGMAQAFLESQKNLHPRLIKSLKIHIQETQRCRKILAKAKSSKMGV